MLSNYGRSPFRSLIVVGVEALSRADAALAKGDKLGALRDYAKAYGALRPPDCRAQDAPAKRALAAKAIADILAEVGREAFGPDLCPHGTQTRSFVCWCCKDLDSGAGTTSPGRAADAGSPLPEKTGAVPFAKVGGR